MHTATEWNAFIRDQLEQLEVSGNTVSMCQYSQSTILFTGMQFIASHFDRFYFVRIESSMYYIWYVSNGYGIIPIWIEDRSKKIIWKPCQIEWTTKYQYKYYILQSNRIITIVWMICAFELMFFGKFYHIFWARCPVLFRTARNFWLKITIQSRAGISKPMPENARNSSAFTFQNKYFILIINTRAIKSL